MSGPGEMSVSMFFGIFSGQILKGAVTKKTPWLFVLQIGDEILYPSLPKSSKYLLRRSLDPLKAFSGGVWGSKHLLTRYLED